MALTYKIPFGMDIGLTLTPHRFKAGYRASKSKHGPHEYVSTERALIPYIQRGWSVRMSAPGHAPSLISPGSITGWHT